MNCLSASLTVQRRETLHEMQAELRRLTEQTPYAASEHTANRIELWRVRKGTRELRCITKYLPTGIDLRLLEGDDVRRTQLCRDAPAVDDLSIAWREALAASGKEPA